MANADPKHPRVPCRKCRKWYDASRLTVKDGYTEHMIQNIHDPLMPDFIRYYTLLCPDGHEITVRATAEGEPA